MTLFLLITCIILSIATLILVYILIKRKPGDAADKFQELFKAIEDRQNQTETRVKDEIARNREETTSSAKHAREELSKTLRDSSDSLLRRMTENAGMQKDQLDSFSKQLNELTKRNEEKIESMRKTLENQLRILQEDNS